MRLPPPPSKRAARAILACGVLLILLLAAIRLSMQPPPAPVPISQPIAVPPAPTPVLDVKSTTILELFNPSDTMLTNQLNDTALSQRIEHILLASFVLSNCNLMSGDEYRDTFRTLLSSANQARLAATPAAVEARVRVIAESASTSYRLVYARTKCDDPRLTTIADQLKAWRAGGVR